MRLDVLIDTLRAHRSSPEDCARQLAASAADSPVSVIARGFRTAMAVGALDAPFGRRLATALEQLKSTPNETLGELPELRALEEEMTALACRQEGMRVELDEAQRLSEGIERHARELAAHTAQVAEAVAVGAEVQRRIDEKQALLTEVGNGRNRESGSS
jgi:hypothetical protein